MKSPAELKAAHDLLRALLFGYLPIGILPKDRKILEAQYHVLCFVLECEGVDKFKNSIDSLKDLIGHVRFYEGGRKFKSQVLVE